jgi:hypothetical protein
MKAILFVCLFSFLLFTNCVKQGKNPLEGSWRLVSGTVETQDTAFSYPLSSKNMKIIGKKYFSTIWQDTTLDKSNWWSAGFNGGTYTFENGVYTEDLMYFSIPSAIGSKASFKAEINSDTLVLTNIRKEVTNEKYLNVEIWKRLE